MKRLSIRWVLTLTMVGVALAAMLVVTGVYSAQATTLFNQMGMSSMLQDMQLVSERIGDVCRRVSGLSGGRADADHQRPCGARLLGDGRRGGRIRAAAGG